MQLTSIYNSFAASLDTSLATIQNVSSSTTLSAADILTAAGAGCDRTGGLLKARFAANVNLTAELAASTTASATTSRRLLSTSCSATAVSVVSVTLVGCPLLPVGALTAPTSMAGCMLQPLCLVSLWLAHRHSSQPAPPRLFGTAPSACSSCRWQLSCRWNLVPLGNAGGCLLRRHGAAGGVPDCLITWLPAFANGAPAEAFLLRLQVTTYPNGSILVAANTSAVLASSNATSNTSSADDVFGTQPLERYIGEVALCSMHGHALSIQVQPRQRGDRLP